MDAYLHVFTGRCDRQTQFSIQSLPHHGAVGCPKARNACRNLTTDTRPPQVLCSTRDNKTCGQDRSSNNRLQRVCQAAQPTLQQPSMADLGYIWIATYSPIGKEVTVFSKLR
eukprot:scpid69311/ scgid20565/ 